MSIINYEKEIRETRTFEFDDPIGEYRHWVRISVNGQLEKWSPRNPDSDKSLKTVEAGDSLEKELELHYKRNYEDKRVRSATGGPSTRSDNK